MTRVPRVIPIALMLTLCWLGHESVPVAQAPPAQPGASANELFAELKWRNVGPNRGGRSIAAAGSVSRPFEYYFGATGGGLWKTTDGGITWKPVSDKFFKTSSVGAVAVSESNPDIIYVGMGETQFRGNIIQGDGVYKSVDGAKTWTHVGLGDTQAIARIRVHPTDPNTVYVAAVGHPYGPSEERGVFRSRDGGATWDKVLFRNVKTGAVDLALDPGNPQVIYAALWEVFRTPHSLSSGGLGSGLYKSTDAGTTWVEITRNQGLPRSMIGKIGVAVSGADSSRVYAIVEAEDGGVFASDDAGATWRKVNEERKLRQRAFYYTRIFADPKAKDTVYVLNTSIHRSIDGGKTYKRVKDPHGDNHDLWIASNDPQRMINANDGGGNVSVNGGVTWTDQDYPTSQMYHVITTTHVPYHVCGAQQDNSTACVSSAGNGSEWYDVGGGESGYIASDPRNPDVFYAGSYGGYLTRRDRKTGHERNVQVWPDNPMGWSAKDISERFQWTYPIVLSPMNPDVIYVGSQHLWRSINEGKSWERISPDLTRADPSTMGPSGGPITLDQTGVETYATIFTIAPSHQDAATLWTGSDDGLVQLTRDNGANWENVTPGDLPPFTRISLIEASPHTNGVAYLAGNRYQRDDWGAYVYRTADFGKSWTRIAQGITNGDIARAIREDTKRPGLLYLGTERGVYVSFDNGDRWQSLSLNLPATPVHDIAVGDRDLVIATHGRSFYILGNISPLRQFEPTTTTESAHLFRPVDVMRSRDGAISIDYFLKNASERVTLEVLDSNGALIKRFVGTAQDKETPKPGDDEVEEEDDGRPKPDPKPSVKAGLHRFTWDLHYPAGTEFPDMILWAAQRQGPVAPPGTYQVRLIAGSATKQTTFAIATDPRLTSVTAADLLEQFAFAMRVRDKYSAGNEAVLRIRHIKEQLKDRAAKVAAIKKPRNPRVTSTGEPIAQKLSRIEAEIYQVRNRSSQDPLNYPIRLNNKLAALLGVIESGDGRPTEQSYKVFDDLSAKLDAQLAQLDQAITVDLARYNAMLQVEKLEPVESALPSVAADTNVAR